MTPRKKLRAIMGGKRLVLFPGAYDALSARVIEAEGFEAIVAGRLRPSSDSDWRSPAASPRKPRSARWYASTSRTASM